MSGLVDLQIDETQPGSLPVTNLMHVTSNTLQDQAVPGRVTRLDQVHGFVIQVSNTMPSSGWLLLLWQL